MYIYLYVCLGATTIIAPKVPRKQDYAATKLFIKNVHYATLRGVSFLVNGLCQHLFCVTVIAYLVNLKFLFFDFRCPP